MSVNIAMSNYNAQMAYSKMTSFISTLARPITSKSTSYEGITDSLRLSPQSLHAFSTNWMSQQLSSVTTAGDNNEYKSTEDISKEYAEELAGFSTIVREIFTNNNLSTNDDVILQSDGLGHVKLVGGTISDTEAVEAVLRDSPRLTREFMHLAARESIINETKENPQFLENYLHEPQRTLENLEPSLRSYMLKFQVHLGGNKVSTGSGEPLYL